MPDQIESTSGEGLRGLSRLMRALELPALLAMPIILALFLASDLSSYVSGQVIHCCGAMNC